MSNTSLGPEEFLIYEVIRQSDEVGEYVLKTELHKLAYLVYKDLQDEGQAQEVGLPVYWYEHGIMVDFDEIISNFFSFKRKRFKNTSGYVAQLEEGISTSHFEISTDLANSIQSKVTHYVTEYADTYGVQPVKDETYERFGNEFVQTLNDFRYELDQLEGVDAVDQDEYASTDVSWSDIVDTHDPEEGSIDEVDDQELLDKLNRLVVTYPEDKYSEMTDSFLEWESITRQLIYNDMYSQLGNFTSDFWNKFSNVELRIHHNENISPVKVHRWKNEREKHIQEFAEDLENFRDIVLENRNETDVLGEVSEAYDEAVDEMFEELRSNTH